MLSLLNIFTRKSPTDSSKHVYKTDILLIDAPIDSMKSMPGDSTLISLISYRSSKLYCSSAKVISETLKSQIFWTAYFNALINWVALIGLASIPYPAIITFEFLFTLSKSIPMFLHVYATLRGFIIELVRRFIYFGVATSAPVVWFLHLPLFSVTSLTR